MQFEFLWWKLFPWRLVDVVEAFLFPSWDFNRSWDLVLCVSSWNCGTELEVWMSFHFEFSCMLSSLSRKARRSNCDWAPSWLEVWPRLTSWCRFVCVRICSAQACFSAVMEDCSTISTSQKQFKICSRLLSSRSSNVFFVTWGSDSWCSMKFSSEHEQWLLQWSVISYNVLQ